MNQCWMWWRTSAAPVFKMLRQEDCEFKANLGYIMIPCIRKQTPPKMIWS
jgi:hypothetical protein